MKKIAPLTILQFFLLFGSYAQTIVSPTTGKTWMDRNLGTVKLPMSVDDEESYGDLYQWGRGRDGHQSRNSATTNPWFIPAQPGNEFILVKDRPYDWRKTSNDNLWQGLYGANNPCPSGYRLPTESEMDAERVSWVNQNYEGAFESPLKFTAGGYRSSESGSILGEGINGYYWTSTVGLSESWSRVLEIGFDKARFFTGRRADGFSVRCIMD